MSIPVGAMYSGGTSSRWVIDAVIYGEIPRPEYFAVFFADTGDEHEWTYDDVDATEERCRRAGIPFFRCSTHRGETLPAAIMAAARGERKRLDNPPFWTENPGGGRGQLRHQCTQVWKTRPLRRAQSEWLASLGLPKKVVSWIGFAADEQGRAIRAVARHDVQWATLDFPAIRMGRTRVMQRADLERWGHQAPRFSMCRRCPFKTPRRWRETPAKDLLVSYEMDEAIRHGLEHVGVEDPVYLTDRLIPIEHLIKRGDPQPSLPGFEPGCDSGMCFL